MSSNQTPPRPTSSTGMIPRRSILDACTPLSRPISPVPGDIVVSHQTMFDDVGCCSFVESHPVHRRRRLTGSVLGLWFAGVDVSPMRLLRPSEVPLRLFPPARGLHPTLGLQNGEGGISHPANLASIRREIAVPSGPKGYVMPSDQPEVQRGGPICQVIPSPTK